ncbi:MAG: SRPBCC domain-containing protein [Salibacteraceae bacterium]
MSAPLIVRESIYIEAPAATIWKHLTTAESTRTYMYGIGVQSSWKVGEPVNWYGPNEAGEEHLILKGTLLEYDPYRRYQYDIIWISSGRADIPDNYTTVTLSFTSEGKGIRLSIEQGDFATLEGGQKAFAETPALWKASLEAVRQLAEKEAKQR